MTDQKFSAYQSLFVFARNAAIAVPAALGVTAFVATSAMAATQCQQIQAGIAKTGSYIYHYKDPTHPDLDLYHRLVDSSSQCNAGSVADDAQVEALAGCNVERCFQSWGDSHYR